MVLSPAPRKEFAGCCRRGIGPSCSEYQVVVVVVAWSTMRFIVSSHALSRKLANGSNFSQSPSLLTSSLAQPIRMKQITEALAYPLMISSELFCSLIFSPKYWLVVSTYPSEKWWSSSVGMMTFPTEWKVIKAIIQMFQTTNQSRSGFHVAMSLVWQNIDGSSHGIWPVFGCFDLADA